MIHKFSDVHPDAKIGKNVKIGSFSHIAADVEIGDNTEIMSNVNILDGARIGSHCTIFPTAVISAVSQDLKYQGEYTTVEIGDHTTIREGVTIHRGTADRWKTVVGSHTLLMSYVHIAHDCVVGDHCIIAGYSGLSGHTVVEDYAILEGKVGTGQFIRIGAHSFIAGGSLVRKNIPPFVKAAREPISYIGINSVGLKRRGYDEETIRTIEKIYKILYIQNKNMTKAIQIIRETVPDCDEKELILQFIAESPNGIMKGV